MQVEDGLKAAVGDSAAVQAQLDAVQAELRELEAELEAAKAQGAGAAEGGEHAEIPTSRLRSPLIYR